MFFVHGRKFHDFVSFSFTFSVLAKFRALTIFNFGEKFLSNGAGIFFGTENRNGIELYHLQNTGKFFAFSRLEAWQW